MLKQILRFSQIISNLLLKCRTLLRHVLFLLYEIIACRKPSDKFMEYAQMVGMFLLFALLIWANFNDIMRFLF